MISPIERDNFQDIVNECIRQYRHTSQIDPSHIEKLKEVFRHSHGYMQQVIRYMNNELNSYNEQNKMAEYFIQNDLMHIGEFVSHADFFPLILHDHDFSGEELRAFISSNRRLASFELKLKIAKKSSPKVFASSMFSDIQNYVYKEHYIICEHLDISYIKEIFKLNYDQILKFSFVNRMYDKYGIDILPSLIENHTVSCHVIKKHPELIDNEQIIMKNIHYINDPGVIDKIFYKHISSLKVLFRIAHKTNTISEDKIKMILDTKNTRLISEYMDLISKTSHECIRDFCKTFIPISDYNSLCSFVRYIPITLINVIDEILDRLIEVEPDQRVCNSFYMTISHQLMEDFILDSISLESIRKIYINCPKTIEEMLYSTQLKSEDLWTMKKLAIQENLGKDILERITNHVNWQNPAERIQQLIKNS